jgi:hypothetical protein
MTTQTTQTMRLTGHAAIDAARADSTVQLHKHSDPTEGARTVTLVEAIVIADEDHGLIWCEIPAPTPTYAEPTGSN